MVFIMFLLTKLSLSWSGFWSDVGLDPGIDLVMVFVCSWSLSGHGLDLGLGIDHVGGLGPGLCIGLFLDRFLSWSWSLSWPL